MERDTYGDGSPEAGHDVADHAVAGREVAGQELAGHDTTGEEGMATAEYAVATLGAVGLAGLLIVVLKSEMVRGLLEGLIKTALSVG